MEKKYMNTAGCLVVEKDGELLGCDCTHCPVYIPMDKECGHCGRDDAEKMAKLRRRIEDRLRKNKWELLRVAKALGMTI